MLEQELDKIEGVWGGSEIIVEMSNWLPRDEEGVSKY